MATKCRDIKEIKTKNLKGLAQQEDPSSSSCSKRGVRHVACSYKKIHQVISLHGNSRLHTSLLTREANAKMG